MKEFENINDILDFAINEEQKAVDLYTQLAANADSADVKAVFTDFAKEEITHKAKLMSIKENGLFTMSPEAVIDLKIADYKMSLIRKRIRKYFQVKFFMHLFSISNIINMIIIRSIS